LVGWV
jgi:hypothetical protein